MKLIGSDSSEPEDDGMPSSEVAILLTVPEVFMGIAIGQVNAHQGTLTAIKRIEGTDEQTIFATLPARLFQSLVESVTYGTQGKAIVRLQEPQP